MIGIADMAMAFVQTIAGLIQEVPEGKSYKIPPLAVLPFAYELILPFTTVVKRAYFWDASCLATQSTE